MSIFTNYMMAAAAAQAGAATTYSIDNSCMFDFDSSSYLSRSPASNTNRTTWTMSFWFKLCKFASTTSGGIVLFSAGDTEIRISNNDNKFYVIDGSSFKITNGVFRDPTSWNHIVIAADTTQSTASDRLKLYVNGSIASLATDSAPAEDFAFDINSTSAHYIGKEGSNYMDGYIAEFYIIDGTQEEAADFGETNSKGVWIPKEYSGSYGTNGCFLDFESSGDLGNDMSGNNNDFSLNNIGSDHQSSDTPTNNHCVWNIADRLESDITLSEGNKRFVNSTGSQDSAKGTFFPRTGKWYWEVKWTSTDVAIGGQVGISQCDMQSNEELGNNNKHGTGDSLGYRSYDGKTYRNSTLATFGDTWDVGDVISVAMDLDNGFVYFGKNGTWQNSGDPTSGSSGTGAAYTISSTLVNGGGWGPAVCNESSAVFDAYFTEAEWQHSAPTNFLALNTTNLAAPDLADPSTNFQVATYTGNGSTQSITFGGNSNMQPDIVWMKCRSDDDSHVFQDAARGTGKALFWNNNEVEDDVTDAVTSFATDGFALGDGSELANGDVNTSSRTYVSWNWAAGNSGSSNTDGSINTTTTYVDTTAGMSISTYTGTGSGATVGHGLGVTPTTVWVFPRSIGDSHIASNWESGITVYSEKWVLSSESRAESSSGFVTGANSTTFTIGTDRNVNQSTSTYLAYSFVEVVGFSKFGTYTGEGEADGPYSFCGFTPEMIMIKFDGDGEPWTILDRARDTYNPAENFVIGNDGNAETTLSAVKVDFLSNGFKLRGTDNRVNANDGTYVFAAFAKHPFGGSGVAVAPAVL